ncbi:MAG: RyR domain-containing protein [Anaerolineales bacterium]|jgi:hypothetical protein
MPNKKPAKSVIVAGDITMNWNIATSSGSKGASSIWKQDVSSSIYWERGGAAQMADLIETASLSLPKDRQYTVHQAELPRGEVSPLDKRYHHSFTIWKPFKYSEKSPNEKPAWRVEHFLGFDRSNQAGLQSIHEIKDVLSAHLVVLADSGLGYRDQEEFWPQALYARNKPDWIVLKTAQPIARGPLWERLVNDFADRLVVITTVNDLRQTAVQVSRNISWERTAQDVCWELTYNPLVNSLSRCAHVIVSFYNAGAILLSWKAGRVNATLFFDPFAMEGEWDRGYPGQIVGYTSCLTTAIVYQMMLNQEQPDFSSGIQRGVAAMRCAHAEGFGERGSSLPQTKLQFPIQKVMEAISGDVNLLSVTSIQDPTQNLLETTPDNCPPEQHGFWTIMEDRYTNSLEAVARQIVVNGFENALREVPIGRFEGLVTVDRREIEALHSIQNLISEYCCSPQKKPLNVAVFGPPGSGKSFGVEQVAKSILGDISVLTFNLSQFGRSEGLYDALHQVRDAGLSGKTPLVFWDEFDTALNGQPLGWLRYLLAPMQDGSFQEGQLVHPIGRCIFVFAGGTSHCMEEFGATISEEEKRAVKLPDFVSRLRGYLNVLGPNPQGDTSQDPFFILRRAIVLRSIFERNVSQIIRNKVVNIDLGILRAFLNTHTYKHGVRSMESIIGMSSLAGKTGYERSSLPSEEQLTLHVEARDFLSLVRQIELEGELLEKMAAAAHEIFCEGLKAKGYQYGPLTDSKQKTHSSLIPYTELPEDEKEQNRLNVRDIANKLSRAGYVMRPARSHEHPFNFPGKDLDILSELEHERWVKDKLNAGWKAALKTDKEKKLHKALVPWADLPDNEKEKDREMVCGIPRILARAGFAVEKSG